MDECGYAVMFIGNVTGQGVPRDPQGVLVFRVGLLQDDHGRIVFAGYLLKDVDLDEGEAFDVKLEER